MCVAVVRAGTWGAGGVWEVEQLGWGELSQSGVGGVRGGLNMSRLPDLVLKVCPNRLLGHLGW